MAEKKNEGQRIEEQETIEEQANDDNANRGSQEKMAENNTEGQEIDEQETREE